MDAATCYRDVEDVFCQGDIFEDVPHAFLKERPTTPRPLSLASKKAGSLIDELSGDQFHPLETEVILPAHTLVARAVLLSHGCEIDKDKKHRIVALIRPMTSLRREDQEHVRRNGRRACFYLPPGEQLPEGDIDFRRISTVCLEWLEKRKRVKSLSEIARRKMLLALFLFFARLELDDAIFETREEQEE